MQRFRAEAEANLDPTHIVLIYEVGEHQGLHDFSMKLVDGGSLAQQVPRLVNDSRASARVVATMARAVHFAHRRFGRQNQKIPKEDQGFLAPWRTVE